MNNGTHLLQNTVLWGNGAGGSGSGAYLTLHSDLIMRCSAFDEAVIAGPGDLILDSGNLFMDPGFCDPMESSAAPTTEGDYRVNEDSPCLDDPECGRIGALGAGCAGPVAVKQTSWSAFKALFLD